MPSRRFLPILTLTAFCLACGGSASDGALAQAPARGPLPACEWCGAAEAPEGLSPEMTLAGPGEPGERLVLEGTVFQPDGRTPAAGVLLYAYHTNAEGVYPQRGDETGNARRHGYLRGWLRTGEDGRYRIDTIRPAAYPGRTEAQHIHMTVQPPGGEEAWIDSVHFDDDPLLTEARRQRLENRGGSGIVRLERGEDGVWRGRRDIVLER